MLQILVLLLPLGELYTHAVKISKPIKLFYLLFRDVFRCSFSVPIYKYIKHKL